MQLVILGADHRIIGILSERDIVRVLAEQGSAALNEPVGQVMTRDVKTCSENDTIESLMDRMTAGKFRHMPVVEQGKLIGIVSIGDVVKNRVEEIERETAASGLELGSEKRCPANGGTFGGATTGCDVTWCRLGGTPV